MISLNSQLSILNSLQVQAVDEAAEVGGEQFHADGQQNDTEEFTEDGDECAAKETLQAVDIAQHKVVDNNVDEQGNEDVHVVILGTEGDDGGQCPRSRNEREGDRDYGRAPAGGIVLEDFHPQNHLESHDEQYNGTRNGKGLDVDTEQFQGRIAQKEEDDKDEQRDEGCVERMELVAAVFEGEKDGDGTRDVDDGKEDQKGTYDLDKINHNDCGIEY